MPKQQVEVWAVLARDHVIARREHRELGGVLDWLLRRGRLRAVLPGVYAAAEHADSFEVRIAAVPRWDPDAVVVGAAAARLLFWPDAPMAAIELATSRRGSHRGYRLVRRVVRPELVTRREGVRLAIPALAALDLAGTTTEPIDLVLRSRTATLDGLWDAFELTRGRRGNAQRLAHLIDSRDEPWSAAERLCHRLLRDAGLVGWESNLPVLSGGRLFYLDVAFPARGVVVEVDGRLHEDDPDVFENDRWRQNSLVVDGWQVVRVTWDMLTNHSEAVLETIRAALASASSTHSLKFRQSICRDAGTRARRRPGVASEGRSSGEDLELDTDPEHEPVGWARAAAAGAAGAGPLTSDRSVQLPG